MLVLHISIAAVLSRGASAAPRVTDVILTAPTGTWEASACRQLGSPGSRLCLPRWGLGPVRPGQPQPPAWEKLPAAPAPGFSCCSWRRDVEGRDLPRGNHQHKIYSRGSGNKLCWAAGFGRQQGTGNGHWHGLAGLCATWEGGALACSTHLSPPTHIGQTRHWTREEPGETEMWPLGAGRPGDWAGPWSWRGLVVAWTGGG